MRALFLGAMLATAPVTTVAWELVEYAQRAPALCGATCTWREHLDAFFAATPPAELAGRMGAGVATMALALGVHAIARRWAFSTR